ncbi:MAG: formamidopyrimidine-DNA glycosylase, partial [Flavobacteriales bacterium]
MPELPDLAVIAKHLSKQIVNHTVQEVRLHIDRKANATPHELNNALANHKVKSIYREGKELHLEIGDSVLGFHLMLHGEIRLASKGEEVKFPIIQLDFPTQTLYLTDWQKAATPTLNPEQSDVVDALQIEAGWFKAMLGRKKTN